MTLSQEYKLLLELFFHLVQSQAERTINSGEEWLNNAQTLSIKLFRHLSSMHELSIGSALERAGMKPIHFIDHASIKVLARAALETYLVFHYLFGSEDKELCRFRHDAWVLGGLSDRQHTHVSIDEHREKQDAEKKQIHKLQTQLRSSPYFSSYSKNQQMQLLNGKWRIGKKWINLGVDADFNKKYFEDIYSYLCGYSHASYISALQVGQAKSIQDQQLLTRSIISIGMVIMAHYSFAYSTIFKSAKSVLDENPMSSAVAEKWHFRAEDMTEIYGR
jgi:hypothetical protein